MKRDNDKQYEREGNVNILYLANIERYDTMAISASSNVSTNKVIR